MSGAMKKTLHCEQVHAIVDRRVQTIGTDLQAQLTCAGLDQHKWCSVDRLCSTERSKLFVTVQAFSPWQALICRRQRQMSTVHELGESSAPADPTIGQPRPSTLFDGEVPVVHSVSRFGRQTTRIPRPSHLNTATIDAPTQQPSAPEQSPVMVYSRVSQLCSGFHGFVTQL